MEKNFTIRIVTANDIAALQNLYTQTILNINSRDYNTEQVQAWAATANRTNKLLKRIQEQYFVAAVTHDDHIVGFCSLEENEYIDLLYVHKDFQRRGIAQLLYCNILQKAIECGARQLYTEASITAKPFFLHNGFAVSEEQQIKVGEQILTNFKMIKAIDQSS